MFLAFEEGKRRRDGEGSAKERYFSLAICRRQMAKPAAPSAERPRVSGICLPEIWDDCDCDYDIIIFF